MRAVLIVPPSMNRRCCGLLWSAMPNQHLINQPNWGLLHLTPLRGAGEAGRWALETNFINNNEVYNVDMYRFRRNYKNFVDIN